MLNVFSRVVRRTVMGAVLLAAVAAYGAQIPQVSFVADPAQPNTNDVVLFDASASEADGADIVRYAWDFEGDGVVDVTTDQPQTSHFFDQSRTYNVTLTISDSAGGTNTVVQPLEVALAPVTTRRTYDVTLTPNRVLAGGSFFVTITLQLNQQASGLGLAERVPAGWRTRPLDDGGAIFKRDGDELQWLWPQTVLPGETLSVRYEVDVPVQSVKGHFALSGTVSSFAPQRFRLSIASLLDVEVL